MARNKDTSELIDVYNVLVPIRLSVSSIVRVDKSTGQEARKAERKNHFGSTEHRALKCKEHGGAVHNIQLVGHFAGRGVTSSSSCIILRIPRPLLTVGIVSNVVVESGNDTGTNRCSVGEGSDSRIVPDSLINITGPN
jgi:hypothetical protein